jgi:fused signal recognition particle receptor
MFGSQDDKNAPPAPAQPLSPQPAVKKPMFGWIGRKARDEQPLVAETAPGVVSPPEANPPVAGPPEAVREVPAPGPQSTADASAGPSVPAAVAAVPLDAPAAPAGSLVADAVSSPAAPAFSRFRINAGIAPIAPHVLAPEPVIAPVPSEQAKPADNQGGWFARLRQGLSKTGASLGEGMASLFLGKKAIDDDLLEELETRLLSADVGVEATTRIIGNLTRRVARKELADSGALYQALQEELVALLKPVEQPLQIDSARQPHVILVVGVNGVGKTTTIGKLAARLQKDGKKVMLAAGDTFRAAAVEQLQVWGERNQVAVIAQHTGADSASVIFDGLQAARARGMDVLIADTAGRLHTKDNLMEELKKVRRVIAKLDATAPHEVLLVLDAGTGQNAINQTRQFIRPSV